MEFSELSLILTKNLSKEEKKNNGIFFTPNSTVKKIINKLRPYIDKNQTNTILEPSCGSCEFINELQKYFINSNITGIELNKKIYESIKKFNTNNTKIINVNFLKFQTEKCYNLIVGNPPYFVIKKKEVDKKYDKYYDGRPNIFILFIIKSLKLLKENGILCFVLPSNFTNCLYYDKTRKYIVEHFTILDIIHCEDKYLDTTQNTIILIIKKNKPQKNNNKFILYKNKFTIINNMNIIENLKQLYENSKTLIELGCSTNIGSIVWNQCKTYLTEDSSKTRLIYSSDIVNNTLSIKSYKDTKKKNYIYKKGINKPLITVNRGYGSSSYNFIYCLIEGEFEYLIENHLICINKKEKISKEELLLFYKKIIESFDCDKTKKFINLYFGNNSINATELLNIMPIYGF